MIIIVSKIQCQCFICKQAIVTDEDKVNQLDPCAVDVYTNADLDLSEQKSQTFFCHYECFQKVNNDDNSLFLDSLQTPKEVEKENQTIQSALENFSQVLYEKAAEEGIWAELLKSKSGKWIKLKELISKSEMLRNKLNEVEELILEPLLICWLDDYSSKNRSQNCFWKVIIIATESHYEFPVTLLIHLENVTDKHSI